MRKKFNYIEELGKVGYSVAMANQSYLYPELLEEQRRRRAGL